eukprot:CAMPEP_0172449260 /NCGR_PEP_ID=MMETSP1065-20121228/8005_1 /TAXON_ID=265537 /ORGANISM="Amphiprora paludosa, Strain CCMP125" /LENGTH=719 /DNA_ID=CAMNT_0013200893 /DNA_START=167 /DNA_END=2326 /DNA_ORIENTATION=-
MPPGGPGWRMRCLIGSLLLSLYLGSGLLVQVAAAATTRPPKHDDDDVSKTLLTPDYWPRFGGDRQVVLLDGLWKTAREEPSVNNVDAMDPHFHPSQIDTGDYTSIPSTVDQSPPGTLGYRGVSYFRRTVVTIPGHQPGARLQFQSCGFYCRVWINGHEIGEHRSGWTAFFLDIPPEILHTNGTQEVFVLADNRFNQTTAPVHTGGDFWHYGGLFRSVEWHGQSSKQYNDWPWRLYVLPQSLSTVHLELHLMNLTTQGLVNNITITFDNATQDEALHLSGTAVNGVIDLGIHKVPHPRIWSTHDPQLHVVHVELHGAILSERFGLRLWTVDPVTTRIQLNGHILKLVGYNHHLQWPETGATATRDQLQLDLQLLQQAGSNFVRGAHYPQDPRWLDLLDEHGIVAWSETLGPGVHLEDLRRPLFRKYQEIQMKEMLDYSLNHASIAFWGFFNEGPSDTEEACLTYYDNYNLIKARDKTRFVSYAGNKKVDVCYGAADVISRNCYPTWLSSYTNPDAMWNDFAHQVKTGVFANTTGKPFLISETGASGLYEWDHNETAVRWSLEYQARVIAEDVHVALNNSFISGISLWHFFDFKTEDKFEHDTSCDYLPDVYPPTCGYIDVNISTPHLRPGGLNVKGIVDYYRRKKQPIFDVVALLFNATRNSPNQYELSFWNNINHTTASHRHKKNEQHYNASYLVQQYYWKQKQQRQQVPKLRHGRIRD